MFDKLHTPCSRRSTHGDQINSHETQPVTRKAICALPGGTAASDTRTWDGGRQLDGHGDAANFAAGSADFRVGSNSTSESPTVDFGDTDVSIGGIRPRTTHAHTYKET